MHDGTRGALAVLLIGLLAAAAPLAASPARAHDGEPHVDADSFQRTVLMELFTATWCGPCKFSDPAADAVLENHTGRASLVRYHFEDALMTEETRSRAYDDYEINGVPYIFVDGVLGKQGLNSLEEPMQEALENYTAFVEERMAVPSPAAVLASTSVSATEIAIRTTVASAASIRGQEIQLRAVVHESDIFEDSLVNDRVTRAMLSTSFIAAQNPTTHTFTIPLNASWVQEELGVLVFVQSGVAGEVHQSTGDTLEAAQRPAVAITSHGDGGALTADHGLIQGYAVSASAVQFVDVRVDGGPWETAEGTDAWSYALETVGLEAGSHTIEARAYDGVKYSDTHSITVEVPDGSNDPPIPAAGLVEAAAVFMMIALVLLVFRRRSRA